MVLLLSLHRHALKLGQGCHGHGLLLRCDGQPILPAKRSRLASCVSNVLESSMDTIAEVVSHAFATPTSSSSSSVLSSAMPMFSWRAAFARP